MMENENDTASMDVDKEIYIVTRGKIVDLDSKLKDAFKAGKTKDEIDKIAPKIKEKQNNYSGTFFKNYFKVDQPIKLIDVGFYGPFEAKDADYRVHIEIFKSKSIKKILLPDDTNANSIKISENSQKLNAKKEELFYIGFNESIYIEPWIWYLIQFQLNGPPTLRCTGTFHDVQVNTADGDNIQFQFATGSKQMPCLRFKLA